MKKFVSFFALLFVAFALFSSFTRNPQGRQEKKLALYGVAFYNLENLFDTLHDAGKNDYEFLPNGRNDWGKMKYEAKLHNMSRVLSELCTNVGGKTFTPGAAVIGVSEIENSNVLDDLLKQPEIAKRGYKYVNYPGVDRRGVECGFLYNPRFFTLEGSMIVPYVYGPSGKVDDPLLGFTVGKKGEVVASETLLGDTTYITRGFLVMHGKLGGDKVYFIVNHWPSRAAGDEVRQRAGFQVARLKDALMNYDPQAKVIIMGDLNDDPANKSVAEQLACVNNPEDVKKDTDLYNPWYNVLYKVGQGTLLYDGKWNLFDQIIVSGNLVGKDRSTLKLFKHQIFMRDYLFQQEGRYRGNPLRTHAGGVWLNGYSDHLPTEIYLVKEL